MGDLDVVLRQDDALVTKDRQIIARPALYESLTRSYKDDSGGVSGYSYLRRLLTSFLGGEVDG